MSAGGECFGKSSAAVQPKKSCGQPCMEFLRRFAPYSQGS
jgi:hypothetical protein